MFSFLSSSLRGACLLIVTIASTASAQTPVVLFSDLISAPASGWSDASPSKGAVVTVWGRNFGTIRGDNFVTVNGVSLNKSSDYLDVWGKRNNPVPFLETITFQLNDSMQLGDGSITVSVDGITSNALPFRINGSEIKFVDINATTPGNGSFSAPDSDPMRFINSMSPGDVVYFRKGTYDQKFDGGKSVIWIRDSKTDGTAQDPISFLAYPGEDVHLDTLANGDVVSFNRAFQSNIDYVTIAKFRVSAHLRGIWSSNNNRVIGNDVTGVVGHSGGDGAIHTGSEGPIIFGNSIHGARSGNKLDHAIYIDGCQDVSGGDIAYNYIWDNNVGLGPLMVDNHQNTRCTDNLKFQLSNYWHHNVVSAENYPSRCLGIYDLSWDEGESKEPDPAYIFNNIFIECGNGWSGAVYHINGYAFIYNNTFFDSRGKSIQLYDNASNEQMLGVTIVNNVFVQNMSSNENAISNDGAAERRISVDNNFYSNSSSYASDANAVTGSPNLIVDSRSYHPVIVNSASPLINSGSTSVTGIVNNDFYSADRIGVTDIGAVEYVGEVEVVVRPNPPTGLVLSSQ